jgi:hypothetical protein
MRDQPRRDRQLRVRIRRVLPLALITAGLLAGCVVPDVPVEELFPPSVGDFLRISGPTPAPDTGVDEAIYQGPTGTVVLRVRWVGRDQVEHALSQLPPSATDVGYDSALGPRSGTFFTFGNEYHAAWGNGDWVFVLSASSEAVRAAFLAFYGF